VEVEAEFPTFHVDVYVEGAQVAHVAFFPRTETDGWAVAAAIPNKEEREGIVAVLRHAADAIQYGQPQPPPGEDTGRGGNGKSSDIPF